MTVQAHNAKRPHYRASPQRELRSGRTYRASMLEALHPELYSEKYANRPTTAIGRMTKPHQGLGERRDKEPSEALGVQGGGKRRLAYAQQG